MTPTEIKEELHARGISTEIIPSDARLTGILSHWRGRTVAFTPVMTDDKLGDCFGLGIAEFGTGGYTPIPTGLARFDTYDAAANCAEDINLKRLNIDVLTAAKIIADTMKRPARA